MSETIFLIEIQGYNLNTDVIDTLYYSTSDLTTSPTDVPSSQFWEGRVENQGRIGFSSNLFGATRLIGQPTFNIGSVDLVNIDGGLDFFDDYAFGGRMMVIYRVENGDYASKTNYISGLIESATISYDRVVISFSDNSFYLKEDIQDNFFLGDNSAGNGVEGEAENIKDTPKPLAYGKVVNATPVLVNSAKRIYQLHDGSIDSVANVYDGRTAFSFQQDVANSSILESTIVNSGNYATCLSEGYIKIGNIPQKGITVDFNGDNTGGYVDRAGAIVKRIIETKTDLTVSDLDVPSFTQFDIDFNYECGVYWSNPIQVSAGISEILGPVNYWTFNRSGIMSIGVFKIASGIPLETFTVDETIDADGRPVSRVLNSDTTNGVPVWRLNYQWGRNYTVQTRDNVYTSVTDDVVAFTSLSDRTTSESDLTIVTKYPLSPELTVMSLLTNQVDADLDKVRVHDLFKVKRNFYRFKVQSEYTKNLNLDDVIELIYPRFNIDSGILLKVTSLNENATSKQTTIEAFG